MYDSIGLLNELHKTGQRVAFMAVSNTLLGTYDRNNGSRKSSGKMVGQAQNPTPKDERNGATGLAGSANMSSLLSNVDRVQTQWKNFTEATSISRKNS